MSQTSGRILVATLVVALLVVGISIAVNGAGAQVAQGPQPPQLPQTPAGPPPMSPRPMGVPGGMMAQGMMGQGMMGMSMPAVAVIGQNLYVVQGNMIYKYDQNLSLVKQCELPKPMPKNLNEGPGAPPMGAPSAPNM